MRSLVAGSLVALSVGMLVGACGDDTAGTGGGGTGGDATTTSSGGGEGGGTGGCTNITVPSFEFLGQGPLGLPFFFGGAPDPALGGAAEDLMVLQIWNPELSGTVDLGSATSASYETCEACALVFVDADAEGNPTKTFFQTGGTLTITSLAGGYYLNGSLSNVNLIEVAEDAEGALSPVAGGACITINSQAIAIDPPVAGWECDPGYYEDGEFCDCRCGAVDPDCSNTALEVDGCYEGQTCSSDGLECEGVPTAWTCEPTKFGTGDGCDCLCGEGIQDADCEAAPTPAAGCEAHQTCGSNGACVPAGWTCAGDFYEDGEYCDCECGAVDPDCSIAGAQVFGCETGEVCNASGMCE